VSSLEGSIGEISFADLLQMCAHVKCTGTLVVASSTAEDGGGHIGRFYFEGGELRDAVFGDQLGIDAVYAALYLEEGAFHVEATTRSRERRIFSSVSAILMEGARRSGEHRRHTAAPLGARAEADAAGARPTLSAFAASVSDATSPMLPRPPPSRPPSSARRGWLTATAVVIAAGAALFGARGLRRAGRGRASVAHVAAAAHLPGAAPGSGAPAAASPASSAQGVTRDEILFGMAAPFSGPARELGRQMKQGIETAFGVINDAGGVNGRRLRLVTGDDGYEPTRTLAVMKDLAEQRHVFAVIGNVGTPTAAVALPFALERKMLFFGAFTGASLLRRTPPDRYVFNFRASYAEETAAAVGYLVKTRHVRPTQIAVFAQQDAFGDAGYSGVTKALRGLRAEPKAVLRFGYKRNTIDVDEALARLREHASAVRAVVMVATYRAAAKFVEKVRQQYPRIVFTNVSFVGGTALADELMLLGPQYANGMIVTQVVPPIESHSTAVLKYRAALAKYFPGEKADSVSLEGYWMTNLLIEGLKRTGPDVDTERLIDALEAIHGLDLGLGVPITFGPVEHQGSHMVWAMELDGEGRYTPVDLDDAGGR
jgi:ABC-type branched-subunit amino acid transport system substrate-binding protein